MPVFFLPLQNAPFPFWGFRSFAPSRICGLSVLRRDCLWPSTCAIPLPGFFLSRIPFLGPPFFSPIPHLRAPRSTRRSLSAVSVRDPPSRGLSYTLRGEVPLPPRVSPFLLEYPVAAGVAARDSPHLFCPCPDHYFMHILPAWLSACGLSRVHNRYTSSCWSFALCVGGVPRDPLVCSKGVQCQLLVPACGHPRMLIQPASDVRPDPHPDGCADHRCDDLARSAPFSFMVWHPVIASTAATTMAILLICFLLRFTCELTQ